ncbi:hypothetical protein LLEC1_06751 [Akanthomyces lecanii]|uniref:Peptidase S1 domain-containing protein n=1 Tax=Cordyceps confragosa TaxID=2714763 RepID=A0A179IG27_CORDF|nr:hypothetical protein LLEC1_06751 [Akanthomyces lecanii]
MMLLKSAVGALVWQCSFLAVSAAVHKRIVSGMAAEPGEFPWIVSIQTGRHFHNCAGTLLDSTTVLTAAHCTTRYHSQFVRAGSLNSSDGGVVVQVQSRRNHPEYQEGYIKWPGVSTPSPGGQPDSIGDMSSSPDSNATITKDEFEASRRLYEANDIAVLKLKTPIPESDTVAYAKLPISNSDPMAKSTAVVAGWYKKLTSEQGAPQPIFDMLNKVAISILARDYCRSLAPEVGDRDTVVCTDSKHGNACVYDSGGPLVDKQTREVIGVASFSLPEKGLDEQEAKKCGDAPMMYTRVASYLSFIHENLGAANQTQVTKPMVTQPDC